MHQRRRILYSCLVVSFLYGCKMPKEVYYSYQVNSYVIDTTKRLVTSSSLISFGDFLFEFHVKINIRNELGLESGKVKSSIEYDTVGIYLLQNKNPLYCELDTFAIQNKVIKTGKLWEKLYGQHFDSSDLVQPKPSPYFFPVDTIINNIKCYYATVNRANENSGDYNEIKIILIKKPKFNSLNKISGAVFPDKDYCIIGINAHSFKNNDGFVQEIDALRPLTEKEKSICESMIVKSKSAALQKP
jgi:hypothetical protein